MNVYYMPNDTCPFMYVSNRQAMVNCTGAGDSLVAGTVYGLLKPCAAQEPAMADAIQAGVAAARLSVESATAVPHGLSPVALEELLLGKG